MGLFASTWLFGAALFLLVLLAVIFVAWPMLRRQKATPAVSRKDANVVLYRERIAELKTAVALGELNADEAALQEEEAGRLLLDDAKEVVAQPGENPGGRWMLVTAMLFIPFCAVLVYLQGDGWRLINTDDKSPPWDFIIQRAEVRLEKNPQDAETRVFLARSYRSLERYAESAKAYAELNRLTQQSNPDYLVEEGEMLAMLDEGNMRGRATELFNQALKVNPRHGKALWYAGLAALQREDEAQAIGYWQTLSAMELPDSFRQVLDRQLSRLGAEVPSSTQKADAIIRVKVSIADELSTGLPASAPVFVYAKAVGGPARPLAATRLQLKDLPAVVELSNDMGMGEGPGLTDFEEWEVQARVAMGGTAQSQSGDPIGRLMLNSQNGLSALNLQINTRWEP